MPMSYVLGLIVLGIGLGYAIFKFSSNSGGTSAGTAANRPQALPIQSEAVLDIAAQFICPCGSCSDSLDECTCDAPRGAVEVKSFIAQKFQEGHKKPHIVEMVQERYGGLKSISEPLFKLKPPLN
jgi:cytochrome c-type biogenesis protein CcmH/NrfF